MSEAAKLILVGTPHSEIVKELAKIKAWDAGANYPIIVDINGKQMYDSIQNVENALNVDLSAYIQSKVSERLIVKSGSLDDLYVVDNPENQTDSGVYKKNRNKMTHLKPKKKKRK